LSVRTLAEFTGGPNPIAGHYTRFRVEERLLLTGHSHQAWPDVALEGQIEAWTDAAERVDDKWERAAEKADRVRQGFARLLGDGSAARHVNTGGGIALGASTHELVLRFLSALPLRERPRLVTSDGEFHTLRRQLDRLGEERGIELVKVPVHPAGTLADRLIAALDRRTAAALVSSVMFADARIVTGLDRVLAACRAAGAELLVDVYHQLNVVPLSLAADGLDDAFVVGGGYKYCQLGEGNCFLRVPRGREHLRPVLTGWFSEFGRLASPPSERNGIVPYGEGAARWAGATYDPTSHYRAERVFAFFQREHLTPEFLRLLSRHQVLLLARGFDALNLDPQRITRDRALPLEQVGGFLALTTPHAAAIAAGLRAREVYTDHRGDSLRLGPAPYLSDRQLEAAIAALGDVVRGLAAGR
jgi:kynureninase